MKYILMGLLISVNAYATGFSYGDKVVDTTACNVKQGFYNLCGKTGFVTEEYDKEYSNGMFNLSCVSYKVVFPFKGTPGLYSIVCANSLKRVK